MLLRPDPPAGIGDVHVGVHAKAADTGRTPHPLYRNLPPESICFEHLGDALGQREDGRTAGNRYLPFVSLWFYRRKGHAGSEAVGLKPGGFCFFQRCCVGREIAYLFDNFVHVGEIIVDKSCHPRILRHDRRRRVKEQRTGQRIRSTGSGFCRRGHAVYGQRFQPFVIFPKISVAEKANGVRISGNPLDQRRVILAGKRIGGAQHPCLFIFQNQGFRFDRVLYRRQAKRLVDDIVEEGGQGNDADDRRDLEENTPDQATAVAGLDLGFQRFSFRKYVFDVVHLLPLQTGTVANSNGDGRLPDHVQIIRILRDSGRRRAG